MNKTLEEIKLKIGHFFKKTLGDDLVFVIIYGSWALGTSEDTSDVDMVAVCRKYTKKQMKKITSFAVNLHKTYGLGLDEEIPYKNKLLVTRSFAERAIFGKGFEKKQARISIQPIVKTKEFLCSEPMALRLFLNAIATKNIFCGGDYQQYLQLKERALINYVRIFYSAWKINHSSVDDFVEKLIRKDKKTGQFYMGFEDHPFVRAYLCKVFTQTFNTLVKGGYLTIKNSQFVIKDSKWFREIILQ